MPLFQFTYHVFGDRKFSKVLPFVWCLCHLIRLFSVCWNGMRWGFTFICFNHRPKKSRRKVSVSDCVHFHGYVFFLSKFHIGILKLSVFESFFILFQMQWKWNQEWGLICSLRCVSKRCYRLDANKQLKQKIKSKTRHLKRLTYKLYTKRFGCFSWLYIRFLFGVSFFSPLLGVDLFCLWTVLVCSCARVCNAFNDNDGRWHMLSIVANNWITHANSMEKSIYLLRMCIFKWV